MPNVLMVERDAFLVSIYGAHFERMGIRLVGVSGSEACIRMLSEGELVPAAIILSLMLERTDGFSLLETLRRHERFRTIPVFVLSRLSDASDIHRCHLLGCRDYFIKAHTHPEEVLNAVRRFVPFQPTLV